MSEGRMFGLTRVQMDAIASGEPITLTWAQQHMLIRLGLIADVDDWYDSPTGSFVLVPRREGERRRERVVTARPVRYVPAMAA